MPAEGLTWLPKDHVLSDDELVRACGLFARLGVRELRITGGEPLVRPGLPALIARLRELPGIEEIGLTTNGVLLADRVADLVAAGVTRMNVSLDSLDPVRFAALTRRDDLARTLAGLEACEAYPQLSPLKVNAVAIKGVTEPEVLPFAELARRKPYVVRFIEVMPLDAPREWRRAQVLSGAELRAMIETRFPLVPLDPERPSATATRWGFADGAGEMQFVSSVTEPFCGSCDRLRLTSDGQLRTCLFASEESDLRGPLRAGAGDAELEAVIRGAVAAKQAGHGMADPSWTYVGRPMSMIGG
jgi:cyclic pyranopterin phosphate synthase